MQFTLEEAILEFFFLNHGQGILRVNINNYFYWIEVLG